MVLGPAPRKGPEGAHEKEGTWYIKAIIITTIIKTMHVNIFKNLKRKAHTLFIPSSIHCSHPIWECSLPGTLLAWEESEPQEQTFPVPSLWRGGTPLGQLICLLGKSHDSQFNSQGLESDGHIWEPFKS